MADAQAETEGYVRIQTEEGDDPGALLVIGYKEKLEMMKAKCAGGGGEVGQAVLMSV